MALNRKKEIRIIKKYLNRRLYDTSTSTYIVQNDIKNMLIAGEEVKVVEANTNKEITRSILLQIILDEEINGAPIFSNEFLIQIILLYGNKGNKLLGNLLEQSIEIFKNTQKQFYEQLNQFYEPNGQINPLELWRDFMQSQMPNFENIFKNYIEKNTENFMQIHKKVEEHTRTLIDYMTMPFQTNNKKDNN